MWRAVSTEVQGWRDALTDRTILGWLTRMLCLVILCAAGGAWGAGIMGAYTAVSATSLAALVGLLVWLRIRT